MLACSADGGSTWTQPVSVGSGDFAKPMVGPNGDLYVAYCSGASCSGTNQIQMLNRFSSCANGLAVKSGFPVVVSSFADAQMCPIPGLDRCNGGDRLSGPMVAVDNDNRVYVTFTNTSAVGNEDVLVFEMEEGARAFANSMIVSGSVAAHRFMPWICASGRSAFVSWYDRSRATAINNSLTDYLGAGVAMENGALVSKWITNASGNADPECATGFPSGQEFPNLATSCVPAQMPGVGGGVPKYGDYNGNACAGPFFFAAWASATAPPKVQAAAGIATYVLKLAPSTGIEIKPRPGMCLDVPNAALSPVFLQAFPCHGGSNQRWLLDFDGQGLVSIRSVASQLCLDRPNSQLGYIQVQQYPCHGGDNQKWQLYAINSTDPSDPFDIPFLQVRTADRGWGLQVDPADPSNRLTLTDNLGSSGLLLNDPNTAFQFVVHPSNEFINLSHRDSAWVADVPGSRMNSGARVQIFPPNDGGNQKWRFDPQNDPFFTIRNLTSDKCLTAQGSGPLNPLDIVQSDCVGSDVQNWRLVLWPNGSYQIRSRQQSCLGVTAGSQWMQELDCDGSNRQLWSFVP
jgi:hypothetical protein